MKRLPEKQLTKDDPESDEPSENPSKGFDKAPPEVLAKRRIVKARRTLSRSTPTNIPTDSATAAQPTAPAPSNPFANLPTAPPAVTAPTVEAPPTAPTNPFAALANPTPSASDPPSEKPSETPNPSKDLNGDHPADEPKLAVASKPADPTNTKQVVDPPAATHTDKPDDDATKPLDSKPTHSDTTSVIDAKPVEGAKPAEDPKPIDSAKPVADAKTVDAKPNDDEKTSNTAKLSEDAKSSEKPQPPADVKSSVDVKPSEEPKSGNGDNPLPASKDTEPAKSHAEKPAIAPKSIFGSNGPITFGLSRTPISFGGLAGSKPLTFASAAKDGDVAKFTFSGASNAPAVLASNASATPKDTSGTNGDSVEPAFKEVESVATGEEGEDEPFRARAKLYVLESVPQGPAKWRERGVGQLKMKRDRASGSARLLMRTEATLRVVLNTPIFSTLTLDKATERSLRFTGFDDESGSGTAASAATAASAPKDGDEKEGDGKGDGQNDDDGGKRKSTCFLVRFSTADVAAQLVDAVEEWKKTEAK